MLASGTLHDAIVAPGETDILVLILWARSGTPLPERTSSQVYRGIDGRVPFTGTEWEFEAGLAAHKLNGAPDLLAYRKSTPPKAEYGCGNRTGLLWNAETGQRIPVSLVGHHNLGRKNWRIYRPTTC